jgi:diguanylate cyclase (GGDEF)-like protein
VNEIFTTSLAILAGLCLYAALYHLWMGWRRPPDHVHLLFGLLSLVVTAYVLAKLGSYRADTAQELVAMRRLVVACAAMILGLLPWFAAAYSGEARRAPLIALSLASVVLFAANQILPYGVFFAEMPELRHITLPWGETVTDLRQHKPNPWFYVALILYFSVFIYALLACVRQFRSGDRQRARSLGLALAVFFAFSLINQAVNFGLIEFIHTAEFGFVALVLLMNWSMSQELRRSAKKLEASEHRFRSLVEQSPFSIQVLSPDGRTLQVNRAWENLWGVQASALADYNILEDRQLGDKGLLPYVKRGFAGESLELPPVIYNPQDTPEVPGAPFSDRWVRAYIYPIKDAGRQVREVILMHEDITERKRAEDAIQRIASGISTRTGEDFFRDLVAHLADLFDADLAFVGVLDPHRQFITTQAVHANGTSADNFSYRIDGTPCANVIKQGTCVYPSRVQHLFPRAGMLAEMQCEGYIGTPLLDGRNQVIGLVSVLSRKPLARTENMSEMLEIFAARAGAELQRLHAEERIRHIAYYDFLTGLANRASLHEYLLELIQRSERSGRQSAMLLIDLDHFKTINDALSHHVGDLVLSEVARRLTRVAGNEAFVARLGGDEFVLLAAELSAHAATAEIRAKRLAEAVVAALEKPVVAGEQVLKVDASIGVTLFPQGGSNEHDILRHADIALYRAKSQGRGSIQFFLADMQARVSARLDVEKSLRHALAHDGLALHLQPQFGRDGRILSAEGLLRCARPDAGILTPEHFIPVAEETGLIHPIGQWALARACACLKAWANSPPMQGLKLSVNVSSWQFVRDDFIEQVERNLVQSGVAPSRLTIELTESALFYDIEDAIRKMHALKAMGLRLALDDFGTGYSSLSYLKKLPLDELKIDRSFVQAVTPEAPDVFIESIIGIGHAMGMQIIAEGVETAAQRDALAAMGCDGFQGYLWSRPLTEDAFMTWAEAQETLI